jgi:sugar lactone lactonase YvrE
MRGRGLLALAAVVAVVVAGCGDGGGDREGAALQVEVATRSGDFRGAIDATPTPDGRTVYFTATGADGPGVFRVAAGGGEAEMVVTGPPFRRPVGIAISTDGSRLFVADPDGGAVFTLATAGGGQAPVVLAGTDGTAPRGLEVVREGDRDVLYLTGRDPADGAPAVFRLPAAGGVRATTVLKGSPLTDPDAVTATGSGVVFVTDRGGAVYRVTGSGPAERIAGFRPPDFAGVSLTPDGSTLLVSALAADGTDQVLLIELGALRVRTFNDTIGANRNGGGLHRAHGAAVYAWADLTAGPDRQSRVYVLRP